jgi:hypothetical protein
MISHPRELLKIYFVKSKGISAPNTKFHNYTTLLTTIRAKEETIRVTLSLEQTRITQRDIGFSDFVHRPDFS